MYVDGKIVKNAEEQPISDELMFVCSFIRSFVDSFVDERAVTAVYSVLILGLFVYTLPNHIRQCVRSKWLFVCWLFKCAWAWIFAAKSERASEKKTIYGKSDEMRCECMDVFSQMGW